MKKQAILLLLLFVVVATNAQIINGIISDNQSEPIPNVVLILQKQDSSFVSATTTDSIGNFSLEINIGNGFLQVQHLAYESQTISFANNDFSALKNITLTEKTNQLDGVIVKADAPAMVVKDNALVYNAHRIAEKKAVSNAFELLKYTPCVTIKGDEVSLAGASQLTVIIDGKATMLDNSEIAELLKSMPASSIDNIEIMYKAPAKYGVKGALINIATDKRKRDTPLEAELASEFIQQYYSFGKQRANIAYRGDKLDFDVLATVSVDKDRFENEEYAINNYNGQITNINMATNMKTDINNVILRTSIDYNFNDDNSISLMYYAKGRNTCGDRITLSNFLYHNEDSSLINSKNGQDDNIKLHNINLKGSFGGLELTGDYVSYNDKLESKYISLIKDSITTDYHNNSTMNTDQLKLLASYDWEVSDNWQISVGAQGTLTKSATEISYMYPQNGVYLLNKDNHENNLQKERRFSVFAETFNTIFDSIQLDFTLELEYFKSDYDENGTVSTLWNEWRVYPNLSIMWPIKNDILQFSLSTYKNYPTYWELCPYVTQMNPYSFHVGNSALRPATNYDFSLAYLLKQQYSFEAFCYYWKDEFWQLPYQDAEECRIYYQTVNYDYSLNCGIGGDFPFSVGFWEPEVSGYLIYQRHQKDDFHGTSFKKDKCVLSLGFDNTFTVSEEKPNLKLSLGGTYHTKAIEGLYDVNYGYDVEIGMKWVILNNLIFTAKWSDIFEKSGGYPLVVNYNGQYDKLDRKRFNRFNTSLVWRIGGFKAKEVELTDTERMQR